MRSAVYLLLAGLLGCRQAAQSAQTHAALTADAEAAIEALTGRMLTSLNAHEAQLVCDAAAAHSDLCLQHAVFNPSSDNDRCTAQLQSCRDLDTPPTLDCSLAHFDLGADCTATVADYLSCLDDFTAGLSCEQKGQLLEVRAGCLPLLRHCRTLAAEFGDPDTYVEPCDTSSAPARVDHDDDIRGLDACRPVPARMVALGDSIAACLLSLACAPDLIADYLREHYAPDLQYERYAVSGSHTRDWMKQAENIPPAPGHLLVWVYLGGNDLIACANGPLTQLIECIDDALAAASGEWQKLFTYFNDRERFPDGVTFLLNTQYTPDDECRMPSSGPGGAAFDAKLAQWNDALFIQPALTRPDTITVDQYPDWLGHGRNANKRGCPYCDRDNNERWLEFDGIHPNAVGQTHIADKWKVALDAMYGACSAH